MNSANTSGISGNLDFSFYTVCNGLCPATVYAEPDMTGIAGAWFPVSYSLADCAGSADCSLGFNLTTDGSINDSGVSIISDSDTFNIVTLDVDTTNAYDVLNGTSMATPNVAGLAALIKAFNPGYTYSDIVSSIKNGGDNSSVLSGKSTTGKAVDAWGSMQYINQPTGVTLSQ